MPVAALRELVPRSLEIDLFDGVAYVGVVPFVMEGVRPRRWPESWAFRFLETNVRTYVLHNNRPGVYFFSLDASSRLAVWAARCGWGLPYYHARMSISLANNEIQYSTQRIAGGARHAVRYSLGDVMGPSAPGSLEHFLLERYLLFVERRGRVLAGQVHHQPYPAQRVEISDVYDELISAAGLPAVDGPPRWAHFASGVDVEVFSLA